MSIAPRMIAHVRFTRALVRLRMVETDEEAEIIGKELSNAHAEVASLDDSSELQLRAALKLSASEAAVLTFMACVSLDRETRAMVVGASAGLTLAMIREIVYGKSPTREGLVELSNTGVLRRLSIIERTDGGSSGTHEENCAWTLSRRILEWVCGDVGVLTRDLSELARIPPHVPRLETSSATFEAARAALRAEGAVVVATGSNGQGRRSLLARTAEDARIELLEIDAKRLAKEPAALAKQLRLIARECKLLARVPLIRNIDALVDDRDQTRIDLVGNELVAELDTNVLVTCGVNRPQIRWGRPVIAIEVKPPTGAQRAKLWRELLSDASEEDAEYLATQYPLAPAVMHQAAQAALARAAGQAVKPDDIVEGIRAVLDDKLGNFAKRIEVTQTWDDLVIDPEQAQAITELIARIRQRRTVYEQWGFAAKVGKGLGVSALFSGPPGTGKTMVAALIAKELGLELYQVDMGKLVSKWIGETEKQLGEMFDAAEAGHAILLFDEADSMFGKRTEVRSSNDRYANLETNYLLQRLESFTGICLLTSNHESNIDPAFQRRLSLHLRFNVPDEDEREKLWRAMLPARAPVDANVDFTGLARRYAMTGGYIKNAALRAPFLAADEGKAIGDAHLEYAARLEYEGMGKIAMPAGNWPAKLSATL